MTGYSSDSAEALVRPLDDEGQPIEPIRPRRRDRRGMLVAGGVVGLVVVLAVGAVIAWNTLVGSPYGAAEAIPADADFVVTMDFLQIRDTERVERFIQAFAEPMAAHGIIDEVPDFEAALQEFDDEAEAELGFRFAEDVFSWVGRSGAFAVWFPEDLFAIDPMTTSQVPEYLATIEVRDEAKAQAFLDRMVAEALDDGVELQPITVAGNPGYAIQDPQAPAFLMLYDGRFLLGDSVATLRRAVETAPADSVAQTDEFQELTAATGGDALMTMYTSSHLIEQVTSVYEDLGLDTSAVAGTANSAMAAVSLDDDGILVRSASGGAEQFAVAQGRWAEGLPADAYGFVDVVLPEAYFENLSDFYLDVMAGTGLTAHDIEEFTAPVDEVIGMSLLDDLLPQFGGELVFAAAPADDGALAVDAGIDVGLLFGIGVQDAQIVEQALDNAILLLAEQGLSVIDRDGVRVLTADGLDVGAVTVTDEAFVVSSSPDMLDVFARGNGRLGASERYQRIDELLAGEGLALYVDIAAIVDHYATDPEVRDVLAPLVGIGASYTVEGEYQVTEFRLVVDY